MPLSLSDAVKSKKIGKVRAQSRANDKKTTSASKAHLDRPFHDPQRRAARWRERRPSAPPQASRYKVGRPHALWSCGLPLTQRVAASRCRVETEATCGSSEARLAGSHRSGRRGGRLSMRDGMVCGRERVQTTEHAGRTGRGAGPIDEVPIRLVGTSQFNGVSTGECAIAESKVHARVDRHRGSLQSAPVGPDVAATGHDEKRWIARALPITRQSAWVEPRDSACGFSRRMSCGRNSQARASRGANLANSEDGSSDQNDARERNPQNGAASNATLDCAQVTILRRHHDPIGFRASMSGDVRAARRTVSVLIEARVAGVSGWALSGWAWLSAASVTMKRLPSPS